MHRCTVCCGPAAGSLATRPTATVSLTCTECDDRIGKLIGGGDDALPSFDDLTGDTPAPFAHTLTCSLCEQPAGGHLDRATPIDELICRACVAAIRGIAAGGAHIGEPDQPTTTAPPSPTSSTRR